MNGAIAVAGMAASAPSMDGKPDAACHVAGDVLAASAPFFFPAHKIGGNGKFFAVSGLAGAGELEVPEPELERIHVELGGEIVEGTHGDDRCLRMVGGAPGARRTNVVANG